MTVLIVDDNERMRDFIKKLIGQIPAVERIVQCDNGDDAVRLYEKYEPDCVCMDIQLKGTDGLTAARRIRQSYPTAKIIIVTQYDEPQYRKVAADCGVTEYVLKDNLTKLAEIIQP